LFRSHRIDHRKRHHRDGENTDRRSDLKECVRLDVRLQSTQGVCKRTEHILERVDETTTEVDVDSALKELRKGHSDSSEQTRIQGVENTAVVPALDGVVDHVTELADALTNRIDERSHEVRDHAHDAEEALPRPA